jgi:hypothetical protein
MTPNAIKELAITSVVDLKFLGIRSELV